MRILTLDVETMANKGWFWRLFKENIGTNQIEQPTEIISFSWKWLDEGKINHLSIHDGRARMLDKLYEVLDECDAVVTYNGDGFDLKQIRRELMKAGYLPLRPVASIDLFKFVKNTLYLPSNRLDYVAEYYIGEKKLDTGGFSLWREFMNGNKRAIDLMRRYNNRDVRVTEKLYRFFRPYMNTHPYVAASKSKLDDAGEVYECPCCGTRTAGSYKYNRVRRTRCFAVRQVRCRSCNHWFDGKRKKL